MMMVNLNEEASNHDAGGDEILESEDGKLYVWKSETARKSSPYFGMILSKCNTDGGWEGGGRRAKPTKMFSLWTRWPHQSRLQSQDSRKWRTSEICAHGKGSEILRKSKSHRKMCHGALLNWGLLKCGQTTARPKTMLSFMHLRPCRCHLFPGFQGDEDFTVRRNALQEVSKTWQKATAVTAKSLSWIEVEGLSCLTCCSIPSPGHSMNRLCPARRVASQ